MRATIDKAGRLVIPKALRDQLGLTPGDVQLSVDGAALLIEPRTSDDLDEEGDYLVIPDSGSSLSDRDVRAIRLADQR